MERAKVNGVELEYEVTGKGEPLFLVSPVVAAGFLPFVADRSLTDHFRVIRYHKRGWGGSTHTDGPASIEEHVADAAALLDHLEIDRAHIGGHSSGGAIALQLAVDHPDRVHTLVLLEPTLLTMPSAQALFDDAAPALEAYRAGDHEAAVVGFISLVAGLNPQTCRAVVEEHVPGGMAQSIEDADTFFTRELPALSAWVFGADEAATISAPVLSVRGAATGRLWVEVGDALRSWCPCVEDLVVEGVGHLLHMQNPAGVVSGVAAFLLRHPMWLSEPAAALQA